MTRALVVVRLSNLTDETTSPDRQRQVCEDFCAQRGWSVVGVAEDLDVSASTTSPFERPQLSPWLNSPEAFDVLVFWRVDRLVRRVTHLARMIEWGETHGVNLVSATEAHFDLSTSFGQALAFFIGLFGQMEADAISERTKQAARHNLKAGKYRGGHPPFGYQPVQVEGEWRYVPDPVTSRLVREIADRVIAGERPGPLCADLNQKGVPTPQDHFRARQGLTPAGSKWRSGNLTKALRSPTLLGQVVVSQQTKEAGKRVRGVPEVLRGDDGAPVIRSEPVLDRQTFDRLQAALDDMAGKRSPYRKSEALLLQVLFCGVCGTAMYLNRGRNGRPYYRCGSKAYGGECDNRSVRMDYADEMMTSMLLDDLGDLEIARREWDDGEDTAAELAEVDAQLTDIAEVWGTGPFRSGPARERLRARMDALERRRVELAETPYRAAGWVYAPTGQTFREHWDELDAQGRNRFLRDHSVRMEFRQKPGEGMYIDNFFGEFPSMIRAINPAADLRAPDGTRWIDMGT